MNVTFSPMAALSSIFSINKLIKTWNERHFEVKLLQCGNKLSYETTNHFTGKVVKKEVIDLTGSSAEEMIAQLKECEVRIREDHSTHFLCKHHFWLVNDFIVRLFQDVNVTDKLFYETVQCTTQRIVKQGNMDVIGRTLDEMIARLMKCKVMITEDYETHFLYHYCSWKLESCGWLLTDKEKGKNDLKLDFYQDPTNKNSFYSNKHSYHSISLIKGANELMWDFCQGQGNANKHSFSSFRESTFPSKRCHPATVALIDKIKSEAFTNTQHITFLMENFELISTDIGAMKEKEKEKEEEKERWANSSVASKIFRGEILGSAGMWNMSSARRGNIPESYVVIEPKSVPSKLDCRAYVSKFTWAVALITGFYVNDKGVRATQHAELVVEGINNGIMANLFEVMGRDWVQEQNGYFMFKAHLLSEADLRVKICSEADMDAMRHKDCKKSKTWMRTADKMQDMLQEIIAEATSQIELSFNKLGIDSIIGKKGHNCFTWAREKLHVVDIDLGKSLTGAIATDPRDYTVDQAKHKKVDYDVQI
jgi:hypothetical protein